MIIDLHTHQKPVNARGPSDQPPVTKADDMLAEADRVGIDRLCLLGWFWANPTVEGVRTINDVTMAMVARHPDRLHGLCFLNPNHDPAEVMDEIDRCVVRGNLDGIKLEIETNARDPRLDPIMERAAELDVFVLHHAWYKSTIRYANESDPSDIAHLAARHPRTRIVMAHLTGCGIRGVLDIQAYENVSVDTSGSQPFSGIVEYAVDKLGAERVLFGSDAESRDYATQLGRVMGANLTPRQRELVLGLNAARLLKIEGTAA